MHYVCLLISLFYCALGVAQTPVPTPTIVIAPYDATPQKDDALRLLVQFNGGLSHYDAKLGVAIAPRYKNIYQKNIGYIGLAQRRADDYILWRLGVFVDGYQSFKQADQGYLKTRINFYLREQEGDEDIGIGLGLHAIFQPKRNLFYSLGSEVRPVFLTFDWSDKTYLEFDVQQELRAFFTSNISVFTNWLIVNQFEQSIAITHPINRLSVGISIQR